MDRWVPTTEVIAADLIRWTEGIFNRRKRGKSVRIGERQITAEVIDKDKDGWVRLLVRANVVTKLEAKAAPSLLPGDFLRRAFKTVLRGKPERLLWSDETARDAVLGRSQTSRFIPPKRPV